MPEEYWYDPYPRDDFRVQEARARLIYDIMTSAIEQDHHACIVLIAEGLPNTAANVARWLSQLGFEANPDLRVNDKGCRYMARPVACKE